MRRVIYLHTPTVYWLGGGTIFYQLFHAHGSNDIRPREICTTGPLVLDPNYFDI